MRWILFTGTWRLTNKEVEEDVRAAAREVLARGDSIVTGGATGVDYFAMDEAMQIDSSASRLVVIIPATLEDYIHDYRTNWCQAPITKETIDNLAKLLFNIQKARANALVELPNTVITQDHYNLRHDEEVMRSSAVYAFQVNDSTGTQDTIDKAKKAGLPIEVHKKYVL